jgi:hypothetical protein
MSFKSSTLPMFAAMASMGLAISAQAAEGPAGDKAAAVERAYGATILSTYPDGRQAELWLARDGTYTAEGRRHDRSSGVWQVKDDKLCLKQKHPFLPFASFCTALPSSDDKPWQGRAPTGETITIRLVKGPNGRTSSSASSHDDGGKG